MAPRTTSTTARPPITRIGSREVDRVARERFGWSSLRDGQLEAIRPAVEGRDVLAVMPTGYGKSAIYQVACVLRGGLTVVVSPLIALQEDQVMGLQDAPEPPPAAALNSSRSHADIEAAWEVARGDGPRLLLLSAEQLSRDEVLADLAGAGVDLLVVDEAHCVASWGHDFRPDYLRIADAAERLGRPPLLALTATGAPPVRSEVVERLALDDPVLVARGFDRPNIRLEVERHNDPDEQRRAVVEQVSALEGAGLLYVATRRDTESYAEALTERGMPALAYHGGLSASARRDVHERFHEGDADVVVATSAFGMGIDKPDVRWVVHAAVPESLDEYAQEFGRAGRDGEPALATLHYRSEDLGLRRFFAAHRPGRAEARRVFAAIAKAPGGMTDAAVADGLGLSRRRVTGLVNLLREAEVVTADDAGNHAVAGVEAADAVRQALAAAERRKHVDDSRIEMMRGYAESSTCRRNDLLGYFGERRDEPCGDCDVCSRLAGHPEASPEQAVDETVDDPYPLDSRVSHHEWGEGTVMRTEPDRITVFFESEGYKVLSRELLADRPLLERLDA